MFSQDLVEWTEVYVKNRNPGSGAAITASAQKVVCTANGIEHTYLICPDLDEKYLNLSKDRTSIVCLNKKKNLIFAIKNWEELVKYPKLSLIFVSPHTNTKWMVFPHTHNSISPNIRLGLQSMFENVEEVI